MESVSSGAGLQVPGLRHLAQVLLSLSVNGRDAMPNGGIPTLETRNAVTRVSDSEDVPPGRYGVLSVRDTATGTDAGTRVSTGCAAVHLEDSVSIPALR